MGTIMKGKLKATRTCAWTGKKREVEVEYEITPWKFKDHAEKGDLVFRLTKGGVTGFESFVIEQGDDTLQRLSESGWCACAGTHKKYDILEISPEEMAKVKVDE